MLRRPFRQHGCGMLIVERHVAFRRGDAGTPRARNQLGRGRASQTNGAAHTQEIDMPAHDQHGVRSTHGSTVTCRLGDCPAASGMWNCVRGHGPSPLPDPVDLRLGRRGLLSGGGGGRAGEVLAVAPSTTRAVVVVAVPARFADHPPSVTWDRRCSGPGSIGCGPASGEVCDLRHREWPVRLETFLAGHASNQCLPPAWQYRVNGRRIPDHPDRRARSVGACDDR